MKPVICPMVAKVNADEGAAAWKQRFPAILFRRRIYVSTPRHMDAINLAFAGMTMTAQRHISRKIADGKETMLFGSALGDGSEWEWNEEFQNARLLMYGFE